MQCSPIRGIFCHSCCFPNQLLSKKSCKRLRQSKETYKVLILVTLRMKLQDIWITPIWHKIWSNRLLWYKIFKPATKSLPLAITEGRGVDVLFLSFKHESKISSVADGTKCTYRKGGTASFISYTRGCWSSWSSCSCPDRIFSPWRLQRGKPYLCKGAGNMKGQRNRGRKLREVWRICNHETRVYSGNSDHE